MTMKEKEMSVSNIHKTSNTKQKKDNKSRSFRNKSGNNDTDNETDENDGPNSKKKETMYYHFLNNESEKSASSSSSPSPSSSPSKPNSDLKSSQKNLDINNDDKWNRFRSIRQHSDYKDCHCREKMMDQTPQINPTVRQETNHPSLPVPKQTSTRMTRAASSLSPRRHRPQTSVINKIVRQRPTPGAHPVAGMRASELNAYRRSSLGSRITSFTSHHTKDENHSSTSSDDDDYSTSDGIFDNDEEIGFTTSTRTITSENRRSLSFISNRTRRRLSSTRSSRHSLTRTIPIHMEHVTILGSTNDQNSDTVGPEVGVLRQTIVGSWGSRGGDGLSSSSSSKSSSSSTSLMVDSDDDTTANHDTSDELILTPVQVKVETTYEKYRHWQTTTRQGRLCLVVCMLLVCAIIMVIFITVPTLAQSKSQYQINNNHLEESRGQHDPLRVIQTTLIEQGAIINETALLKDVQSIEYEVIAWLAFEDPQQINATLDPDRLVQRYTARFLSLTFLERPGLVNTTKLLQVQPDEDEEEDDNEDHATTLSAEALNQQATTNYLNISQHECLWSVQKIDMGPSLQLEHDQMTDIVHTDDDVIVAEISDADNTPTTAVTTLGQPIHQEKEIVEERNDNFTLGCNLDQQITKLFLEQVTLPSNRNSAVESSLLPVEVGNLIHLEELHLMEVYIDETNQMSFFPTTSTTSDLYNYVVPNLTTLEIDMILTNGESKGQLHNTNTTSSVQNEKDTTRIDFSAVVDVFEGIEHVMPNLSVLKLRGGIGPIPNSIAKLANLTELSIQQFFNIPNDGTETMSGESLVFHFFESFQSKNTLRKLYISQTHWTIPDTNLGVLLPNLTHLKCSENQLTTIPSSIMDLQHLTHLDVSYNYLQSLPLSLLNKLEYLDLSFNDLRGTFDMDLITSSVTFFNLEGNPQLNGTIICPPTKFNMEIRVPPSMSCSCCSSLSSSSSLSSTTPNVSKLLEERNRHRLHTT